MSNVLINCAFNKTKFGGDTLLVLLCLCDHSNDGVSCWPSYDTLSRRTRCSRRHVIRIIKSLIAEGWVEIRKRTNERGQTSNLFILHVLSKTKGVGDICDISKEVSDIQDTKQGGVSDIQDTLGGSNVTLTIREPQIRQNPNIAANAALNDESLTFPEIDQSQEEGYLAEELN